MLFEVMSRLKNNLSRSVHISIGEVPELSHLAHLFGCGIDFLPSF